MNEHAASAIVVSVLILSVAAIYGFLIWTDHQENMAKIQAGQKNTPAKTYDLGTYDLGTYDEKSNTFTFPSGRAVQAPITNDTVLEEKK